jgi:hypothetical protein
MSENNKKITVEQVAEIIKKLENKDFGIYFFTLDTKGNPVAGVANIYEHVKVLNELGYRATILHEKEDYQKFGDENTSGLADWMGEEYANLPHTAITSKSLMISPNDFLVIPEAFATIMQQKEIVALPCKKIVFSQSSEYIFELLPLGRRWTDFHFNDVITTSETQATYLKSIFPSISTHVVPVSIPSYFKKPTKPKFPVISIHTRNQYDTARIYKEFYLKYPIYKWLTFKEMRGLPRKRFAETLAESALAIWIDDSAGFGTFPIEAMTCGTPVIGRIPNVVPEWMVRTNEEGNSELRNNGVWVNSTHDIPDLIANFLKLWLEDSVPSELLEGMAETASVYTEENQKVKIEEVYSTLVSNRIKEFEKIMDVVKEQA